MRALTAALLLVACAAATGAPDRLQPLDEDGFRQAVAAHKSKVVLFDFWATWCEPCREELPRLAALAAKLRARGLVLVTISADEPELETAALDLIRRTGVGAPAFVKRARNDEAFINFIDPKWSGALPALFLYDRQGRRAATFIGETSDAEIEAAVRKLL